MSRRLKAYCFVLSVFGGGVAFVAAIHWATNHLSTKQWLIAICCLVVLWTIFCVEGYLRDMRKIDGVCEEDSFDERS